MKKRFLSVILLFSAILLAKTQTGFATPTYEDVCINCHGSGFDALFAHCRHQNNACDTCHPGDGGTKPIATSKCIVCHPRTGPGECNLVNFHDPAFQGASCLTCHNSCAPTTTTTTTVPESTTTVPESTTTTIPEIDCITIAPNSVTVSGTDVEEDMVVTFTRTDVINIPPEDLNQLVIKVDTACEEYITINGDPEITRGTDNVTAVLNITVKGDAPSSACKIQVNDPEEVTDPPLNCETTFTITQTQTTTSTTVEATTTSTSTSTSTTTSLTTSSSSTTTTSIRPTTTSVLPTTTTTVKLSTSTTTLLPPATTTIIIPVSTTTTTTTPTPSYTLSVYPSSVRIPWFFPRPFVKLMLSDIDVNLNEPIKVEIEGAPPIRRIELVSSTVIIVRAWIPPKFLMGKGAKRVTLQSGVQSYVGRLEIQ